MDPRTAPTKRRDRYVKVDRNAWNAIGYIIAAHVLDDIQGATGWQWVDILVFAARAMAVLYGVIWLATHTRDAD